MTCNVVAMMESSWRKNLTLQFGKPDENGLLVCTIYFRTEVVIDGRHRWRAAHILFAHSKSLFNFSAYVKQHIAKNQEKIAGDAVGK